MAARVPAGRPTAIRTGRGAALGGQQHHLLMHDRLQLGRADWETAVFGRTERQQPPPLLVGVDYCPARSYREMLKQEQSKQ